MNWRTFGMAAAAGITLFLIWLVIALSTARGIPLIFSLTCAALAAGLVGYMIVQGVSQGTAPSWDIILIAVLLGLVLPGLAILYGSAPWGETPARDTADKEKKQEQEEIALKFTPPDGARVTRGENGMLDRTLKDGRKLYLVTEEDLKRFLQNYEQARVRAPYPPPPHPEDPQRALVHVEHDGQDAWLVHFHGAQGGYLKTGLMVPERHAFYLSSQQRITGLEVHWLLPGAKRPHGRGILLGAHELSTQWPFRFWRMPGSGGELVLSTAAVPPGQHTIRVVSSAGPLRYAQYAGDLACSSVR